MHNLATKYIQSLGLATPVIFLGISCNVTIVICCYTLVHIFSLGLRYVVDYCYLVLISVLMVFALFVLAE